MYRYLDHALVRATPWRPDIWGTWPDLSDEPDAPATWRPWLNRVMRQPGFAAALELASPSLVRSVRQVCDGERVAESAARRTVVSVLKYVLRAGSRATPFGLFAGVAPARIAEPGTAASTVRLGTRHRAVARVDAVWLAELVERLETDPVLWPHLSVRVSDLAFVRDGQVVVEHRPQRGGRGPAHVQVRATAPLRAVLTLASTPILVDELAAKLAAGFPGTSTSAITGLLSGLLAEGILVTALHPPTTCTDPLAHLVDVLRPAAGQAPHVAAVAEQLGRIAEQVHDHDHRREAGSPAAHRHRQDLVAEMHALAGQPPPSLAVDLRLDWEVTVPACAAAEAARAAGLLTRLSRRPVDGWDRWHTVFLDRYGPRALVGVRDVVDGDIGLGYPAGYLGALPPDSGAAALTDRDKVLLALAQRAALHRQRELVLDDATIAALTADSLRSGFTDRPQPTTEVIARIHAADARALQQGRFTLAIVGISRAAGTTIGRFLHLLDDPASPRTGVHGQGPDRVGDAPCPCPRRAQTPQGSPLPKASAMLTDLPTSTHGALAAQLCAAPLHTSTANVAAVPRVLPHLIVLGPYRDDDPHVIGLDDLAVTADEHRLYLVSRSRRRTVEPTTLNAVEATRFTHPLARFLTELPHAMATPCTVFDWGAAASLPFLPALRHQRTILTPARWLLTRADLPDPQACTRHWEQAFTAWSRRARLPRCCYLGEGDQRLRLDLDEPSHRAVLRTHLDRAGTASLRALPTDDTGLAADPAPPPDGPGQRSVDGASPWSGGYAHEIVIPLATTAPPGPEPSWLTQAMPPVDVHTHGRLPADRGQLYLKVYGHPARQDTILTRHLPRLLTALTQALGPPPDRPGRYWFLRYHDPDPHLRLRLRVPPDRISDAVTVLTAWATRLRADGLTAKAQIDTDFSETARFGGAAALAAAEEVFAADSAAAVAQLNTAHAVGGPDPRAVTAASMLDLTIGWFHGDVDQALRWLIQHTRAASDAPPRALYDHAITLANPNDRTALTDLAAGAELLARWEHRRTALAAYHRRLHTHAPATVPVILPELLHLHHVRMAGLDLEGERRCLHLARAAALSWTNRPTPHPTPTPAPAPAPRPRPASSRA